MEPCMATSAHYPVITSTTSHVVSRISWPYSQRLSPASRLQDGRPRQQAAKKQPSWRPTGHPQPRTAASGCPCQLCNHWLTPDGPALLILLCRICCLCHRKVQEAIAAPSAVLHMARLTLVSQWLRRPHSHKQALPIDACPNACHAYPSSPMSAKRTARGSTRERCHCPSAMQKAHPLLIRGVARQQDACPWPMISVPKASVDALAECP